MGTRVAIPSRQNLFVRSQEFDVAWTLTQGTIAANAAIAPDGTMTADQFIESAAAAGDVAHQLQQTAGGTVGFVKGSLSIFLKPNGRDWILMVGSGGGAVAWANVATNAIGTIVPSTASLVCEPASNWIEGADASWKRVTFTFPVVDNTVPYIHAFRPATGDGVATYIGDGASGFYMWGAQFVLANWAGYYQPTTAAIVNTGPLRSLP